MTVFLASLLGLPPLAGFAGKFQVFMAVYEAAKTATQNGPPGLGGVFYAVLVVGAANTALSAYYYLRIARAMLLDEPEANAAPVTLSLPAGLFLVALIAALFVLGVLWNPLVAETGRAVSTFSVR